VRGVAAAVSALRASDPTGQRLLRLDDHLAELLSGEKEATTLALGDGDGVEPEVGMALALARADSANAVHCLACSCAQMTSSDHCRLNPSA
jgi:hypothetical protein